MMINGNVPVGTIVMWGGTSHPEHWRICDGASLSTDNYSDLYKKIGDNFGQGAPAGKFYLPDLRGQFIRGYDPHGVHDPDNANRFDMKNDKNKIGPKMGSVQSHALQTHTHTYHKITGRAKISSGDYWDRSSEETSAPNDCNVSQHETRPINAYLNFIIKVEYDDS